jgi:methylthioribose-1-phosphate isomerase
VADSAAGSLMARGLVDRVVVGADRIAANGDVANKVGTYPLAVLAARHGVPFYVAAPVSTIDPGTPDGGSIPIEERDPAEVVEGADAFNPAFDVTPAELVTAVVTEAGVLEPPYGEAIARALVVGAGREMLRLGLVEGTQGNASARHGDGMLVTPASMPYEDIGLDDLVAIAPEGEADSAAGHPPSSEWRVHAAIYAARPDVRAIVHTHSAAATDWSRRDEPLGAVRTAAYAPTGTDDLAVHTVEALGDGDAVLMARHGVVGVGANPAAALAACLAVERDALRAHA